MIHFKNRISNFVIIIFSHLRRYSSFIVSKMTITGQAGNPTLNFAIN